MNTKKWLMAISVGIVGAVTFGHAAFAEPAQYRYNAGRTDQGRFPAQIRHNWNDFHKNRVDLRNDRIEVRRERRDLRRAIRRDIAERVDGI